MGTGRVAALLGSAIAAVCAVFTPVGSAAQERGDDFAARILAMHNDERARIGLTRLQWSPRLEAQARSWANSLAERGVFEHARERGGAGENLWMGSADYYGPEEMIGGFLREARQFRGGAFPDVSRTGRWQDVGHYSQIIWPTTREVGCALAGGSGGRDVLVCRYFPAGNMIGQQVP